MEPARFDQIVSAIYQAGSGVGRWERPLRTLSEELDLWAIHLQGVDKRTGAMLFSLEGGRAPPEANIDYIRHYHPTNPRIPIVMSLPIGQWMHDHEHLDEAYVAQSPFFQDFMIPHGGRYCSGAKLVDDDDTVVMIGVLRGVGQQPLNAGEVDALDRLVRHLASALQIYKDRRPQTVEGAVGHHLLERLSQPVMLLDEQRGIRFRNRAAESLLESIGCLVDSNGYLRCQNDADDRQLMAALLNLLSSERAPADNVRRMVRLTASTLSRPVLLILDRLLPLPTMQVFGRQPMALALLHDLNVSRPVDPFIVAEAFGLTPAEAKVTVQLADGVSPEQIASARQVSASTVRTQVRSVHSKMGVRRQIDLVRLVRDLTGLGSGSTEKLEG